MPDSSGGRFRTIGGRRFDLYDETENDAAGRAYLAEGYRASGGDETGAKLYYFGGPGALNYYRTTGKIPEGDDGYTTFAGYVSGGVGDVGGGESSAPALNLDGVLEPPLKLDGILEPADDDEVVTINARNAVDTPPRSYLSPPSPSRPDIQTMEGRRERDTQKALARTPGARFDVTIPVSHIEDADAGESLRDYYRSAALAEGVPAEYFEKWQRENNPQGYYVHDGRGNELTAADVYDERAKGLRLSVDANSLARIVDDYKASRGTLQRLSDWATSDETSPGEKFVDVVERGASAAAPVVKAGARGLDLATRPLQAVDAAFWARVRGANELQTVVTAYQQFFGDNPELGKNVIAEALRNSDRLKAINPRLPSLLGELSNVILQPSNLIPLGVVGRAAQTGKLARAGEVLTEGARGLRLLDRGLVESRPLGLLEGVAKDAAKEAARAPDDLLRYAVERVAGEGPEVWRVTAPDGRVNVAQDAEDLAGFAFGKLPGDPAARVAELRRRAAMYERIASETGDAEVRSAASAMAERWREELGIGEAHEALRSAGYTVERVAAPNRVAAGEAPDVWKVTGPDGNTNILRDDAELADFAEGFASPKLSAAESEMLKYARERQAHHAAQAETLTDPHAKANAQSLADDYAKEVERLQGRTKPEPDGFDTPDAPHPRASGALPNRPTLTDRTLDVLGVPKAAMASIDLSAPGRQGAIFLLTEPKASAGAFKDMLRAVSSKGHTRVVEEIAAHPKFDLARESGLFLGNFGPGEEVFGPSSWSRRMPGVKVSERTFETFLDSQRMRVFSDFADEFAERGMSYATHPQEYRDLARVINTFTGRGDLGKLNDAARWLNAAMWSPRLTKSRLDVLNPVFYKRLSPAAREVAMRKMLQFTGTVGGLLILAYASGAKVSLDPSDSGFGKIRYGKTHLDITGGNAYTLRTLLDFGRSVYLEATGQKVERGHTPTQIALRFARSKLSPAASLAVDYAAGETMDGEKFTWKGAAYQRLVPLFVQDLKKAIDEEGWSGALHASPSFFGFGVNTYGERKGKSGGPDADERDAEAEENQEPEESPSPSPTPEPLDLEGIVEPAPSPEPSPSPEHEEIHELIKSASPDDEPTFKEFPEGMSESRIPRVSMPQVKGEHRGAMVQFLKARGIAHTREDVAPRDLKPSQFEYSPEKVQRALSYDGPERPILVSSDNHVADGHHQWLSRLHKDGGKPAPVIRLDAPIIQLLLEMARFPSSGVDDASA